MLSNHFNEHVLLRSLLGEDWQDIPTTLQLSPGSIKMEWYWWPPGKRILPIVLVAYLDHDGHLTCFMRSSMFTERSVPLSDWKDKHLKYQNTLELESPREGTARYGGFTASVLVQQLLWVLDQKPTIGVTSYA
jgi:hypothetical protein